MPLRNRNLIKGPSVFFVTTTTVSRTRFPGYPTSLEVIENIMFDTFRYKDITLFGYVIMPSHIHILVGSPLGGPGISKFMHSLKGRVREVLQGKGKFWQDRFDDVYITSEKQFKIKLNYIHLNPVRSGLVKNQGEWKFSSFIDWKNEDSSRGVVFDSDDFFAVR